MKAKSGKQKVIYDMTQQKMDVACDEDTSPKHCNITHLSICKHNQEQLHLCHCLSCVVNTSKQKIAGDEMTPPETMKHHQTSYSSHQS